jgi:hypothetical protein
MKKLAKAKKKRIGIKFERKTPKEDEIWKKKFKQNK